MAPLASSDVKRSGVKYKGQLPGALEERTNPRPDLVKYIIRHGRPFCRKTEIGDADADAIGAYLARNHKKAGSALRN